MSASQTRRWLLFGALSCVGLYVAWLLLPLLGDAVPGFAKWGVFGTPLAFVPVDGPGGVLANSVLFLGLMLFTQWLFLRPLRRGALHGDGPGRPRWHAIVSVALVATLLCTAVVATLLEMPDWWGRMLRFHDDDGSWLPVWIAMGTAWLVWSVLFFAYFRQGDFLVKTEVVVRSLIRGSGLELLIAIPTHALVYRRDGDDCYCIRGSYTGLVFGAAVLLWAFGPGLVLLFLREKQRREPILQHRCPQCGAPLDASVPGGSCPAMWTGAGEIMHDRRGEVR